MWRGVLREGPGFYLKHDTIDLAACGAHVWALRALGIRVHFPFSYISWTGVADLSHYALY